MSWIRANVRSGLGHFRGALDGVGSQLDADDQAEGTEACSYAVMPSMVPYFLTSQSKESRNRRTKTVLPLLKGVAVMREIKVGLIGFGTVGKGVAEVLLSQRERLVKRTGMIIRLAGIADHNATELPEQFKDIPLTRDANQLIGNPDIDIIVELIGGIEPAKTLVMAAIQAGKHVVTANKALLSQEGRDIFAAASRQGVEVGFEASVGGGIPVIKAPALAM